VARQKDNESGEVSWGEFFWVVITGEYNVPYGWPLFGTDAHPPNALLSISTSHNAVNR